MGTTTPETFEIERALEAFARGFSYTRSFTHPFLADRVGPLWALRDGPRKRGDYRCEEWVALNVPPAEADRIVREHTRGRYALCAIVPVGEPDHSLREGYKALGYRLGVTEPLMVHSLEEIPDFPTPAAITRVETQELADRLNRAARSRQVLPQHLGRDDELRQYVAELDGKLVGWVRSIAAGSAAWCSNMYVEPEFRRRGIARTLLCRMLQDDRRCGARSAVLLASHTGAKLYPVVGYRQIGTLYLFTPAKS